MLEFLLAHFDHFGVERVCSGIGAPNIYEYLREVEKIPERSDIAELIKSAKDHTKAIVEPALDQKNPSALWRATVEMLVSILGAEAGNLALKVFATGGVYVAGGVAMHLIEFLRKPEFMEAFSKKGRFQDLMQRIPVHVISARRWWERRPTA